MAGRRRRRDQCRGRRDQQAHRRHGLRIPERRVLVERVAEPTALEGRHVPHVINLPQTLPRTPNRRSEPAHLPRHLCFSRPLLLAPVPSLPLCQRVQELTSPRGRRHIKHPFALKLSDPLGLCFGRRLTLLRRTVAAALPA
eukprot:1135222-Rhodomonas_salina.1